MSDIGKQPDGHGLRRRCFLGYFGSLGLASTLFPGVLWAQSGESEQRITSEMIGEAARLAGLEFSPEQRAEMVEGVNENLSSFEDLRGIPLDQSVVPPLYFNPAVAGMAFDDERRPLRFSTPPDLERPADLEDLAFWPVTHLARLIETRQVRSVELTQTYMDRLKKYNPLLNCVVTFTEELAAEQAARADEEIAAGRYRGQLHGIPWGAKDLLARRGYKTTWGSEAFKDQVINTNATVVERLDEAGAVLIAKLTTGELARGDRWFGGRTNNPWNPEQGSGGSSAGPAAATTAGLVGFAIGTETLGSIVGPSRRCGVTGMRPTYGRVSRFGVMPASWSLDKVGPLCRAVEDCAVVFDAISGPDGRDLSLVDRPFNWDGNRTIDSLRVGYLEEAFDSEPRGENGAATRTNDLATLETLRQLGADLVPIRLPEHAGMNALTMLLAEEAAVFDELTRSGRDELLIKDRDEPEAMLIRNTRLVPAVEYLQMNRVRMLLMEGMAEALRDIDVYVAPSGGSPNNRANNLTGHPGVSVPNGFTPDGMPTGILFVGRLYGEAEMLTLAKAYQDATDFHRQHPNLDG